MSKKQSEPEVELGPGYTLFTIYLIVFTLINSVLLFIFEDADQHQVVRTFFLGSTSLLMVDAFYRLYKANNRLTYLTRWHGWLVVVGSLPIPFIVVLRLLQTRVSVKRLDRDVVNDIREQIAAERANSMVLAVTALSLIVLEVGSLAILGVEDDVVGGNIMNASDAIWWSLVTVSTVGYGDQFPVTNAGRIVGFFMIITGVAIFSTLTSFTTNWFRSQRQRNKPHRKSKSGSDQDSGSNTEGNERESQIASIQALIQDIENENPDSQDKSVDEALATVENLLKWVRNKSH